MNINSLRPLVYALTLLTFSLVAHAQSSATIRGRVVAIADGDTLTVLDAEKRQYKIRLQGIDAPERSQDFGDRSRQQLADLVFGKDVEVRVDKRDRYRRSVSTVMLDGRDVNLEMVRAGLAWHYKQYANEQSVSDRQAYAQAEEEARKARRGLWADVNPTPPWEYRRAGRSDRITGTNSSVRLGVPTPATTTPDSLIVGNRNSKIYHLLTCPNYGDVLEKNRVIFKSEREAVAAGYRKARNCPRR